MKTQNHPYHPKIVKTADGSKSVYVPSLDEHYHSHHGAIQEARHVFITAGLSYVAKNNLQSIDILEVGFGTGLNAFLTTIFALDKQIRIEYTGLEKFPLTAQFCEQLNYPQQISGSAHWFQSIHLAPWGQMTEIHSHFHLFKLEHDVVTWKAAQSAYDLVFFDAFGFRAQEELWHPDIFIKMFELLRPGGTLVTYASKGIVRRAMINAGFIVKKLPGPPGKREMVRAEKPLL